MNVEEEAATGRLLVLAERAEPGEAPDRIPLLPLRSDVVFPQTVVPLVVNRPAGIKLIDDIMVGEKTLGLVAQRHPETDDPTIGDLYPTSASATCSRCSSSPTARPGSSARGCSAPG